MLNRGASIAGGCKFGIPDGREPALERADNGFTVERNGGNTSLDG